MRKGMLIVVVAVGLAGCGSVGVTGTATTTTRATSHTSRVKVDAKRHAAVEKLLKGGPTNAQTALVDRECTVPDHAQIHVWLDEEWSGRSVISVADQIAREVRGHVTGPQRETLALICMGRISKTGG